MSKYDAPDPEWGPIEEQLPPPFDFNTDPAILQDHWVKVTQPAMAHIMKARLSENAKYRLEDHKVPVEGGEINVRVVIPEYGGTDASYPLVIWMHAGGWVVGNVDQDDYWTRLLSTELHVTIVNVEYRLAPQHPFPTGLNDSYAAVKWAASNADRLSASLEKGFIVAGQSAGGNFSAVISHRALADPFFSDKPLTGQFLCVPTTLRWEVVPEKYKSELRSWEIYGKTKMLGADTVQWFYNHYQAPPDSPEMSPALYPSHSGLPPAYIQASGHDPLRDEAILYERLLREAGTPTRFDIYPGLPHGFQMAAPHIKATQKLLHDTYCGFRWLLAGQRARKTFFLD
ncbi:hypothetical protein BV25DRAFT_1338304 [Artomyces pyxidatus]|uniref:Uncharacterized protein n=1 Tax=Artomyces pyxidatus TaxID=48021 RepID=A0ACB8SNR1_9AGAM|nr:hypothetical protein BV25DRAFT_1338304 [Artomyces pyxidatus]